MTVITLPLVTVEIEAFICRVVLCRGMPLACFDVSCLVNDPCDVGIKLIDGHCAPRLTMRIGVLAECF
jgi:hypothetical protein